MPLTIHEKAILHLLLRSPDLGNGWRSVSRQLWGMVDSFARPELLEKEAAADGGGRVRLSDRGAILADYI